MMLTRILTALALILATLLLIAFLTNGNFQSRDGEDVSMTRIATALGYLILVSGGFYGAAKSNATQMIKYAIVWAGIVGLIALAYQVTH